MRKRKAFTSSSECPAAKRKVQTTRFVWARMKSVPVHWPAVLSDVSAYLSAADDQLVEVYVKSDEAILKVKKKGIIPFPGDLDALRGQGIVKLKKKKGTKEAFCSDICWCLEEMEKESICIKDHEGTLQTTENGGDCHGQNENGQDEGTLQTTENIGDCHGQKKNDQDGQDEGTLQTTGKNGDCHGQNENGQDGQDEGTLQTTGNNGDCHGQNENGQDGQDEGTLQTTGNNGDCHGQKKNDQDGQDEGTLQTTENGGDCYGQNENGQDGQDEGTLQTTGNNGDCHGQNENGQDGQDEGTLQTTGNNGDCHGQNENGQDGQDEGTLQTTGNNGNCHGQNENGQDGQDEGTLQTTGNNGNCHGQNENGQDGQDEGTLQTTGNNGDLHGQNENGQDEVNLQTTENNGDLHGQNEDDQDEVTLQTTENNGDFHGQNEDDQDEVTLQTTENNGDLHCQNEDDQDEVTLQTTENNGDLHGQSENSPGDGTFRTAAKFGHNKNQVLLDFSENDMSDVYEYDADSFLDSDYIPDSSNSDEEEIENQAWNLLNAKEKKSLKQQSCVANNNEVSDKGTTNTSNMSTETQSAGKTTVCTKNKEVDGYSKLAIGRKIDEENRIYSKNSSIYIKEHTKSNEKSKDGRVFDRAHACLFCGKLFTNIQVHLEKHTDERIKDLKEVKRKANIANYKEKPYLLREVKRLQNLLRAEGDHVHNLKVMENNSGELLVARRRKGTFDAHEYGPCPQCLEWIRLRDNYAKHRDTCSSKNGCATSVANVQQYIFEKRVSPEASIELKKEVFPSMMQDDITRIAMEDRLILEVGEYHFSSNFANKIKRKNYTSYRMRLAARLLTLLRIELNMPNASYLDLIKGEYFSAFVKCSIEACGVTDDEELKYPSTALKLGFDVSRLAGAKSCYGITNRKDELRNEADDFTKLVEKLWKVHVKKRAATLLEERQFNKKTELPLPDDVAKLAKYLVDSLKSLKLTADPAVFQRVVVLTEARLLLYNRRRPGELEAIRLSTYRKRSQGVDETDLSLRAELTKMEKTLLETQELLEIRGKCGKKVPVLLPLEVKDAMNYLADPIVRDKCGIQRDNPYIFANTRHLSVRAGNALNLVKYEIDLRRPDRILATNLRKHTATISQVMGLDDQQLKWLQRHMGHTERVHLQHYRATSGLIERIDIAKLMLLQEKNMVGRFAGLRLEDITFEDLDETDRAVDDEAGKIDDSAGKMDDSAVGPLSDLDANESRDYERNKERSATASSSDLIDSDADNVYEKTKTKKKSAAASSSDLSDSDADHVYEKTKKRKKTAVKRIPWTIEEVEEVKVYFKEYLEGTTRKKCPGMKECLHAIQNSKLKGTTLQRRSWETLKKKVSHMMHAKK